MQLAVFDPVSHAFQKVLLGFGRSFSLLVGWTVRSCGYMRFLPKFFVGFALTAVGAIVLVENGMGYLLFSSLNRTNVFYNMVLPSLIGEMGLHQTLLKQISRSAVIKKRAKRIYKQRLFPTQ